MDFVKRECPACREESLVMTDSTEDAALRELVSDTVRWACPCGFTLDEAAPFA